MLYHGMSIPSMDNVCNAEVPVLGVLTITEQRRLIKWEGLGTRLRQARKRAGMTQEETADALGIASHSVSMWETGRTRPDASRFEQISRLYRTSIDDLLIADQVVAETQAAYDATGLQALVAQLTPENREAIQPAIERLLEIQQETGERRQEAQDDERHRAASA